MGRSFRSPVSLRREEGEDGLDLVGKFRVLSVTSLQGAVALGSEHHLAAQWQAAAHDVLLEHPVVLHTAHKEHCPYIHREHLIRVAGLLSGDQGI